jgi:hypothetical protein
MRLAWVVIGLLISWAGSAFAAPQLIAPAPGAVVRSAHPLFSWSLPANERSEAIYIASKPDTTPEGRFFSENVVDLDFFLSTQDPRQWSPTRALYAGRYWWLVSSMDSATYQTFHSAPSDFTVPAEARVVGLRIRRYRFLRNLDFEVFWRTNVERPSVSVSLATTRGRLLWAARRIGFNLIGSPGSSSFSWYAPRRLRAGTRLRFVATIRAAAARGTVSRIVNAP